MKNAYYLGDDREGIGQSCQPQVNLRFNHIEGTDVIRVYVNGRFCPCITVWIPPQYLATHDPEQTTRIKVASLNDEVINALVADHERRTGMVPA